MRSMNNYHDEDDDLSSPMPMEDIEQIQRFTEQGLARCDVILRSESSTEVKKERAQKETELYLEDIEAIKIERTLSGRAELAISGVNFWTALAMTSGDYLRRFRWKSGLGVALALYLIVTVVFVWTSLEDEEGSYDDGVLSMISRQLLSAAAGVLVSESVLVIQEKGSSDLVVFDAATTYFLSFPEKMDCSRYVGIFIGETKSHLGASWSISESYWRDVNSGRLTQICKLDADIIMDPASHYRLVKVPSYAAQANTRWSDDLQRLLHAVVWNAPLPQQVPPLQSATIIYLVIRKKNGKFVLIRPSADQSGWEIPYKAQEGKPKCEKRFKDFMKEHAGKTIRYVDPNTMQQNIQPQGSDWTEGQQTYRMCFVDADITWDERRTGFFQAMGNQEAQSSSSLSSSDKYALQKATDNYGQRRPSTHSPSASKAQKGNTAPLTQGPTTASPHAAPPGTIPSVPVPPEEDQNEWDTRTIVVITVAAIGILAILCCAFIVIIGIMSNSRSEATEAVEEKPEEPQKGEAADQAEDLDQAEEKRDEVRSIEDMV